MLRNILIVTALLTSVASGAFAQTVNSTSGSTAAANTSSASTNAGNKQAITINQPETPADTKATVSTVPSMAAPALTTTLTETCMGSVAGGLSIQGFGLTGGKTIVDEACVRRLDARELATTLGDRDAARELMCRDPEINAVYAAVGRPCKVSPKK
jgi:hypothetical protein